MKAIVLAAGKGTRLRPITTHRPKHLLEIAGKSILQRILSQLLEIDQVDDIYVVVNYEKEQIITSINDWYPDHDVIHIIHQEVPDGTGDAVDVALQQSSVGDTTPFIVINGDVLFAEPLSHFITASGGEPLIVGTKVSDPTAFGILDHQDYQLQGLIEKPASAPPSSLVNAGFYIFPGSAKSLFSELGYSERGEREMTDVIETLLNQNIPIKVHETVDGWFDIGKPWQLLDANEYFMDREQDQFNIEGTVEPGAHLHGQVHVAPTARVRSGVYIEGPVYIDEGADIGPNCYIRGRSYLGRKVRVGNACEVKNSLIYEETHAAHLSYIGDSILGRHSNLGAGTITANLRHDGKNIRVTVKGNRVQSTRRKIGVIMGDYVKTGIGVDILPGVKISAKKWINAGVVITRDV